MVELQIIDATADDDEVAACIAAVQYLLQHEAADNTAEESSAMPAWRAASLLESTGHIKHLSDTRQLNRKLSPWKAAYVPNFPSSLPAALIVALAAMAAMAPARAQDAMTSPVVLRPPIPVTDNGTVAAGESPLARPMVAPSYVPAGVSPLGSAPPMMQAGSLRSAATMQTGSLSPSILTPQESAASADEPPMPAPPLAMSLGDATRPGGVNQGIIRVLIASGRTLTQFTIPDGAVLKDIATGDVMAQLPPQSRWQVALHSQDSYPQLSFSGTIVNVRYSRVMIASHSEYRHVSFTPNTVPIPNMVPIPPNVTPRFWLPAMRKTESAAYGGRAYVLVPAQSDGVIAIQGKLYRGTMVVRPNTKGCFDVINYVDVEDYLQSVVPSEMPSGWPLEALKAQAIAARSYATANMGKHETDGYDVKANTEDQVYAGVSPESMASNLAVAQTHGTVLRHAGKVVPAYFHSSSGGWTECAENVWSQPLPFLKAVADYDDQSPHFSWSRSCSTAQAEQILNRSGRSVGMLLSLKPVARGESPRVRYLLANGTQRTLLISGEEARKLFSLPSTCFNVGGNGGSYVFAGRGSGHGLGMSQWGARHLAELGYCAPDILNYYYKDVSIERM